MDPALIERFGVSKGMVVQEFLVDDDIDEDLRSALEKAGAKLVGEDYGDVTDAAVVWFREGDDDLADLLMDVQTLLDDGASVWLLTPKAGRAGHVNTRDIEEGSSLAGFHATSTYVVGDGWTAFHLLEKGRAR